MLSRLSRYFQEPTFKPIVQRLFYTVTPLLSSSETPLTGLYTLGVCYQLLPMGLEPKNVLSFVELVNNQASFYEKDYHNEYCVISAGIISKTSLVALPRNDFDSLQKQYHDILQRILVSDDITISLCLQSVMSFMMSFPGDFYTLVGNDSMTQKLKTLLMKLQAEKESKYCCRNINGLQTKMNYLFQKKCNQMKEVISAIELMKGNSEEKERITQTVNRLRCDFDDLLKLLNTESDRNILQAIEDWKCKLDHFFPFSLVCYE